MHTIVQLVQGTAEWHAHRAKHFNASEASAMLGLSPYQSRSDLLKAKATGITPEVDGAKQRLFDAGHAAEAAARPIAQEVIGQELFPITATREVNGLPLSASYDGATMGDDIVWEHKLMNATLASSLSRGVIPEQYHPQLEQQLLVIGAEKALFMATSSDKTAMECVWYTSNPEMRQRLIAGWAQFKIDLESYVPAPIKIQPTAKVVSSLPVVFDMRVQGTLVSCNLEQYKPAALAYIGAINTELNSDEDFVNADADAKFCRDSADKLELAIEQALGQMGDINQALNTVREIAAAFDAKGLALEKLVKAEKENRRTAIVGDAAAELVTHVRKLNERIGKPFMPQIASDFSGVVKGLKSLDSMKDEVATELARCKIEANATADRIQANLAVLQKRQELAFLFADVAQIVLKQLDDFQNTVTARIAAHEAAEAAKEEATRERIRLEEQAKAEQAAREKLAAEQAAAAAELAAAKASEGADLSPAAQALNEAEGAARFAKTHPAAAAITHAQMVQQMPASVKQAMAPDSEPTLKLGDISTRLGFNVTADFLHLLGFDPAKTDRASKLFHESEFPQICQALIAHIAEVSEQFDAVAA